LEGEEKVWILPPLALEEEELQGVPSIKSDSPVGKGLTNFLILPTKLIAEGSELLSLNVSFVIAVEFKGDEGEGASSEEEEEEEGICNS